MFEIYKKLLNYTCAYPQCESGVDIEAHHIRPLYKGGIDAFWNIIALCKECHHGRKLHSNSERNIVSLYVYKSMHESRNVGFYFDEQEQGFWEKYKIAIKNMNATDEEKFIALNISELKT